MTPQYIQQPHIAISATTMDRHLFLRPCGIGVFIKEAAAAIFLVLFLQSRAIHAFNPSPITTTPLLTRLQNIQCELALSVGRIPGTAMPPEWAASGAKLGLSLEVEFTNETADYEMSKERLLKSDALMGSKLYTVDPLNEPTFVSSKGTEVVKVLPGAYGCQIQRIESQQYAFRFFLDFPEGAIRNDVELPPERIYFLSSCWNVEDKSMLRTAQLRQEQMEQRIQEITRQLESKEEQQGNNLFQKAMRFRDSVALVEKRATLKLRLEELEQTYPLQSERVVRGPNNIIFAKEGVIAVKRLRGAMGTKEQYHWIGTFTYNEFFEEE